MFSSTSSVSRSRSLVGSSSTSTFEGFASNLRQHQAAALAAGQLAERGAGLFGAEQEVLHVADTWRGWPPTMLVSLPPPVSAYGNGGVGLRLSRCWSSAAMARLEPSLIVPLSGASAPVSIWDQRGLAAAVRPDDCRCGRRAGCGSRKTADDRGGRP